MSFHFSQALVEDFLEADCLDGERSAQLRSSLSASIESCKDRTKATLTASRYGMTYEPSTASPGEELLTWFREGFPAKTSVAPEKAQESRENGQGSGVKWPASSAKYDQNTHSWKTHQCSLFGGLTEYSGTWPKWGMMRDGELFPQQQSELATYEKGCGYWPTPTAREKRTLAGGKDRKRNGTPSLCHLIGEKLGFPKKIYIKPSIIEKMMLFPMGWTDGKQLETVRFRQWLSLHGKY